MIQALLASPLVAPGPRPRDLAAGDLPRGEDRTGLLDDRRRPRLLHHAADHVHPPAAAENLRPLARAGLDGLRRRLAADLLARDPARASGWRCVAGCLLGFTLSMDEIAVTFFLAGTEPTLPVYVWGLLRFGFTPEVNAAFTVIAGGSLTADRHRRPAALLLRAAQPPPGGTPPGPVLARRRPTASSLPVSRPIPRSREPEHAIRLLSPQLRPLRRHRRPRRAGAATPRPSGWNGFFIWDHIQLDGADTGPIVDPWVALTAVAGATTNLRIGTMITPLARRRPWKVARETVTLDRVSARPAHLRRRPRLPARGRVRDLRRGDRRPRPGRQARRGARDPRRPLERREGRLRRRALPGHRRPVRAPARPGAADPDLVRRLVAQQTPVPPRRALGRRRPRARPGGGDSRPLVRSAKSPPTSRSTERATRSTSRSTATRSAGAEPRGGLDRRVRGRRPHLVAGADRHRPTFLIRPSTTASPRWPPKRR